MVGIGGHITTLKLLPMNIDLMLIKPRTKHGFKAKYIFNNNFSTSLDVNHFQIQSIMVAYESLRNQQNFDKAGGSDCIQRENHVRKRIRKLSGVWTSEMLGRLLPVFTLLL